LILRLDFWRENLKQAKKSRIFSLAEKIDGQARKALDRMVFYLQD
jgi:hypothetical protein